MCIRDRLEAEGIVSIIPCKGVVVRDRPFEELIELNEIAGSLESSALEAAFYNIRDNALEGMTLSLIHISRSVRRGEAFLPVKGLRALPKAPFYLRVAERDAAADIDVARLDDVFEPQFDGVRPEPARGVIHVEFQSRHDFWAAPAAHPARDGGVRIADSSVMLVNGAAVKAVSYTHLDVYKRQVFGNMIRYSSRRYSRRL